MRRPGRRFRSAATAVAVAALTVSACGSADDSVSSQTADVEASPEVDDAPDAPVESTGSENGADGLDGADGVVDAEPAGLQQNGPVDVDGTPLAPFDGSGQDPAVGTSAPVVGGERFDGSEIVIGAPTENPTLVVFLAHWCGHCNAEVPELVALDESGRIPEGLDVVGVSTAVAADRDNFPPSQWVVDKGWPWPTMADDEAQTAMIAYGGTSFPFAVVLDSRRDRPRSARRAGDR